MMIGKIILSSSLMGSVALMGGWDQMKVLRIGFSNVNPTITATKKGFQYEKRKRNDSITYCDAQSNCKDIIEYGLSQIKMPKPLLPPIEYRQLYCLAQNIFWEAGTESKEAQILLAKATINRVKDTRFPNSLCGVISQKRAMSWYAQRMRNGKFKRHYKIDKKYLRLADDVLIGRYGSLDINYTNWYNTKLDSRKSYNAQILHGNIKGKFLTNAKSIKGSRHVFIAYKG